jgi:DNA-binding transcriptional MerR regulator
MDGPRPDPDTDRTTVDELAASSGTTTRHVRTLQTLGLLPRPELRGRTGLYGHAHRQRLEAILRLQEQGFSLESLRILFDALAAGRTLASVLGLPGEPPGADLTPRCPGTEQGEPAEDAAALYGFAELQPPSVGRHRGPVRPLLWVVPTTVWDESRAS